MSDGETCKKWDNLWVKLQKVGFFEKPVQKVGRPMEITENLEPQPFQDLLMAIRTHGDHL